MDLEYGKSLSTKDPFKYLSDSSILPQKCHGEYMKKLREHFLDPSTEIKAGRLGKNEEAKGWGERTSGTHAFHTINGNGIFFSENDDQDSRFHISMNLNDGQRDDFEDNDNIL